MTSGAAIGRADLLRMLAQVSADRIGIQQAGALCGYEYGGETAEGMLKERPGQTHPAERRVIPSARPSFGDAELARIPFLHAASYRNRVIDTSPSKEVVTPRKYEGWRNAPPPPLWQPLAPWSEVEPAVRELLAPIANIQRIDVRKATMQFAKVQPLLNPPKLERRSWLGRMTVVLDRSTHMVPFWRDQELLCAVLKRHIPHCVFETVMFDDHTNTFHMAGEEVAIRGIAEIAPDILVLGDLGALSGKATPKAIWLELGRAFSHGRARVLSPISATQLDGSFRDIWRIAGWGRQHSNLETFQALTEELLCLISPAIRIEPQLLRQVRVNALRAAGPEIEALVWNHPAMEIRKEEAGALRPDAAKHLRRAFAGLEKAKRYAAIKAMRDWRGDIHPAIWFEEVLELDDESRAMLPEGDEADAISFFAEVRSKTVEHPDDPGVLRWCGRMGDRSLRLGENEDARALIWQAKQNDPGFAEFDPGTVPRPTAPIGDLAIVVLGEKLCLSSTAEAKGSILGLIQSDDGLVRLDIDQNSLYTSTAKGQATGEVVAKGNGQRSDFHAAEVGLAELGEVPTRHLQGEWGHAPSAPIRRRVMFGSSASILLAELPHAPFLIRTDRAELVIQRLTRSDLGGWASGVGRDRFGLWADFTVKDIRQRLRFCPPGRFLMGSPEDEPGRNDNEGPQTEITFAHGFWMFDTPVTQELYHAVTGKNPSRFVSPTRPVDQIDFLQASSFTRSLNAILPGAELRLPSEAEWEYACRAGTTEATYAGPMAILGENNAPVLSDIAWYGGNSGIEFELEDGSDSSDWPDKQFADSKAGTMPVKMLRANRWGIYDTLGCVWEWCTDIWAPNHGKASFDGSSKKASSQPFGKARVVRGGAWFDDAKDCRAASRVWVGPKEKRINVGFRIARDSVGGNQTATRQDAVSDVREEVHIASKRTKRSGRGRPRKNF